MSTNKQRKLELIFFKVKEFNPYFLYYQIGSKKHFEMCY